MKKSTLVVEYKNNDHRKSQQLAAEKVNALATNALTFSFHRR